MRMKPIQRVRMIRVAGAKLAREQGVKAVTPETVAEACPVATSATTVRRYMGTQAELVAAIIDEANDVDLQNQALDLGY